MTPSDDSGRDDDLPYVEIYACRDPGEAAVILDEVLSPNGVEGVVRDRTTHAFPGVPGQYHIAVPSRSATEAVALIREARNQTVISEDGAFPPGAPGE